MKAKLTFENATWKDLREYLLGEKALLSNLKNVIEAAKPKIGEDTAKNLMTSIEEILAPCDHEEYLKYYGFDDSVRNQKIWEDETTSIACWWTEGGSEGYYMHCQPTSANRKHRFAQLSETGILGKFWTPEEADRCTRKAQQFVNHL